MFFCLILCKILSWVQKIILQSKAKNEFISHEIFINRHRSEILCLAQKIHEIEPEVLGAQKREIKIEIKGVFKWNWKTFCISSENLIKNIYTVRILV
jgi:hypothetical protein